MTALRWRTLPTRYGRVRLRVGRPAAGSHPPVVLVPGLAMSSRYMVPTAERLAARCEVAAPDLPGAGRSGPPIRPLSVAEMGDVVAEVTSRADLPAVVIANSFGCQIAVELALRHRELVARLVLTGPVLPPPLRTPTAAARAWARTQIHEPPGMLAVSLAGAVHTGARKGLRNFQQTLRYRLEERLASVVAPVLLVRGHHDRMAPRRWTRRLAALAERGRLVELPAAHALTYSSPTALARLVLDAAPHAARSAGPRHHQP